MIEGCNPILRGFNPDPSIIRVGDDYYIATSTFEWFPGVSIHHSKDLVNWKLVARPLNRKSQLDMLGVPDSCGVWAPCLSYHNGTFYLCFTNVKRFAGDFKDTHNYMVTTADILGEWSEPHHINSSGFDPSLFIDDDGRAYFLNMLWNHRPQSARNNWLPHKYFGGTIMQELDLQTYKLIGAPKNIYSGTNIGLSEGPHLYKKGQYYYLLLAEGGTGKDHACSFARSESIWGPYESDPEGPIVTSAASPQNPIKRAGHGDWVEGPDGQCFLVHLCSRPLPYRGRSVMGRETALQIMEWNESGWPRLQGGGNSPTEVFSSPYATENNQGPIQQFEDFNDTVLPLDFQTLRTPLNEKQMSLVDRPGYLRLYGQESLGSLYTQALVARRQQSFCFQAETKLDFFPISFQQMAGLVCYYNSKKYVYLHVTVNESGKRVLDIAMCVNNAHSLYPMNAPVELPDVGEIRLKAEVEFDLLRLFYSVEEGEWISISGPLDYSFLSDEVGDGGADANFTGAFVGLCCQDLTGQGMPADFDYFNYGET